MLPLLTDRTVRLAVTGLSGAGKTVFITSLVQNLLSAAGNRAVLPFLRVVDRGELVASRVIADAEIARRHFPFADMMARLAARPPAWPPSTTGTSQIRLALRYRPRSLVARTLTALATLNLDIIDYPGEWLLDLPLIDRDYRTWSRQTMALAGEAPRAEASRAWRAFLADHPATAPGDDETARQAAALYSAYLETCRKDHGLSDLQPGRFLAPGEFEGAPMLWFCPLDLPGDGTPAPGSLHALMASRYDAYRTHVALPFFRDHFRRFDRQAILVDVLRALDTGPAAFEDSRRALGGILQSFRFGRASILAPLLGARIDKALIVATKADHVLPTQYDALRQLLNRMLAEPSIDMRFAGSMVEARIAAAVRCTTVGSGTVGGRATAMLSGVLVGQEGPTVLIPGDVPPRPPDAEHWLMRRPDFPSFRPPTISAAPIDGIPHIGMDEALEYLIGDKFV